jgi:hypothetical protein
MRRARIYDGALLPLPLYEEYIPIADRLYDIYLAELRQEGLIE